MRATANDQVEPNEWLHAAQSVKLLIVAISQRRLIVLTTLATTFTPVLGEYIYIGGGVLGTILLVVVVVLILRRV